MAISNETASWLESLQKEGNLSPEVMTQLRTAAEGNSSTDQFIRGSVLRQNDYSRNSAEVQRAKAEAERALAEAQQFKTELETWQSGAQGSYATALKDREEAVTKAGRAVARLQSVAAKYGVAEDEIKLEGFEPAANRQETPVNNFDPEAYKREVREEMGKTVREAAVLDALILDLNNDHFALFGKPLPKAGELVQEALRTGKQLTTLWEEKYQVKAKQSEVAEAAVAKRVQDEVDTRMAKLVSEGVLAPQSSGLRNDPYAGSPVLKSEVFKPPTQETGPNGGGISAAVQAFQSGKFKINQFGR